MNTTSIWTACPDGLNNTLPPGIQVTNVEQVDEGEPALQTQVASAEYRVTMDGIRRRVRTEAQIESVMESESLPRERRGKTYDLRPLIEDA